MCTNLRNMDFLRLELSGLVLGEKHRAIVNGGMTGGSTKIVLCVI